MPATYLIHNSANATTAAPVKQPTGTAIRTMLQLAPDASQQVMRIHEWGFSLDSYANGGQIELVETGTVFATSLSTAYVQADIQMLNDPFIPQNTTGTSGQPLNLGTSLSGFSTGSVTEGSITQTFEKDIQMDPQGPYVKQWPLGLEPAVKGAHCLRIRATFGTTTNMYCYVIVSFGT